MLFSDKEERKKQTRMARYYSPVGFPGFPNGVNPRLDIVFFAGDLKKSKISLKNIRPRAHPYTRTPKTSTVVSRILDVCFIGTETIALCLLEIDACNVVKKNP